MGNWIESYARTEKAYVQAVAATVGGTAGIAVADLPPVPRGFVQRLLRYSVWSNSAGSPIFELFAANAPRSWQAAGWAPDRSTRLDYTATGKNNVSDNWSPPFFDESEVPLFVWSGGSNGDICQAYIMIGWFEKIPILGHRQSAALTHQEAIEDQERSDAIVVGGSGWNMGMPQETDDMVSAGYGPWASRDPADAADNPAQYEMPDNMGQYVGGNELGTPHPRPPYDGRILPDGSTDSTS